MISVDDRSRLRALTDQVLSAPTPTSTPPVVPHRFVVHGFPPVADVPRISVVDGPGGLVRAVSMARDGLDVLVVGDRPASVEGGEAIAPGYTAATSSGRLRWTTSLEAAIAFADVHFVTVPAQTAGTEQTAGTAQTTGTDRAAAFRAAVLGLVSRATRRTLVVGCSTGPVGSAAALAEVVRAAAPVLSDVELAWVPDARVENPDGARADGLTFGVGSPWAEAQLRAVYRRRLDEGTPVVVTDLGTIELAAAVGWRTFRDGTNALMRTA